MLTELELSRNKDSEEAGGPPIYKATSKNTDERLLWVKTDANNEPQHVYLYLKIRPGVHKLSEDLGTIREYLERKNIKNG